MSSTSQHHDGFVEENRKAEDAIAAGNLSEAAGILVKIVGLDPENSRAFNNMGILSWTQNSWEDAYTMFMKSVQLRPDYADALVNLFDAALKLKKIREITPYFEKACSIDPENEELQILHSSIIEQGDGLYQSKRAFSIGEHNPLIEDAKKELESGNLNTAMELFIRANDEQGPNAAAYCGLGIISYYQERYSDALVLFIESIKLNPADSDTFMNLLDAATACNKKGDAIAVFQTYRADFPELAKLDALFEK